MHLIAYLFQADFTSVDVSMSTRDYMAVTPPAGIRIDYGSAPEQFGDLRVPSGVGPHPVVVVVHGGWWKTMSDLAYAGHLSTALTADGFATWNIEYRRVGSLGGGYPSTLHDVAAALNALLALAPAYQLDLARIIVTGHSAGAHIAAWLAAKNRHRELDIFGPSPALIGAVPVAGPLDLERTSVLGITDATGGSPVHDFLGGTPQQFPERYALASPAQLVPTGIRVIAVHGSADAAVPVELSSRYVDAALAAGDSARLLVLEGADHLARFDPATEAGATVRRTIGTIVREATSS